MTAILKTPDGSLVRLPDEVGVEAEKARRSLRLFCRLAWHVVEPGKPLVWGWHLDAMCEHLEAVTRGEIRQLLCNVPPRLSKSTIFSVMWPAWEWASDPALRYLSASYGQDLSVDLTAKTRRLVESDWYKERWGPDSWQAQAGHPHVELRADQNAKGKYETTANGGREAVSVTGGVTGKGADRLLVDDPHNVLQAESDADRKAVLSWWQGAFSNRGNDPKTVAKAVVMQRLHEADLSGHLLEEGGWEHLMLPMEFEAERRCITSIGFVDPRTQEGELLTPERFGPEEVAGLKRSMGALKYAGQAQQRPSPAKGLIFQREWFANRWREASTPAPADRPTLVLPGTGDWLAGCLSVDATFKKKADADRVAITLWGIARGNPRRRWLVRRIVRQMGFLETVAEIRALRSDPRWVNLTAAILIEDAANGPAIVETLQQDLTGVIAMPTKGGKLARAFACQPQLEAGDVVYPDVLEDDTAEDGVLEWVRFTGQEGGRDDEVDSSSHALLHLADIGNTLAASDALAQW